MVQIRTRVDISRAFNNLERLQKIPLQGGAREEATKFLLTIVPITPIDTGNLVSLFRVEFRRSSTFVGWTFVSPAPYTRFVERSTQFIRRAVERADLSKVTRERFRRRLRRRGF